MGENGTKEVDTSNFKWLLEAKDLVLVVKNLPDCLAEESLVEFFDQYGAVEVRFMFQYGRKRIAFVKFSDTPTAKTALSRLNNFRLLDKKLVVEFCDSKSSSEPTQPTQPIESTTSETGQNPQHDLSNQPLPQQLFPIPIVNVSPQIVNRIIPPITQQRFITHYPQNILFPDPIAPQLGVNYAPPCNLEYSYPSPNEQILENIKSALIAYPRFYTQVLHLMNKMNLPTPFQKRPIPPLKHKYGDEENVSEQESSSSSESENEKENRKRRKRSKRQKTDKIEPMSITNETSPLLKSNPQAPPLPQSQPPPPPPPPSSSTTSTSTSSTSISVPSNKKTADLSQTVLQMKVVTMVKEAMGTRPLSKPSLSLADGEEEDDSSSDREQEKLERKRELQYREIAKQKEQQLLKEQSELLEKKSQQEKIEAEKKVQEAKNESEKKNLEEKQVNEFTQQYNEEAKQFNLESAFITNRSAFKLEFIKAKTITKEEMENTTHFKSYQCGVPTNVLFVKHLPKVISQQEIFYLFSSFFTSDEEAQQGLNIKLITQGRLKGQAFITFSSIELASRVLELTHGFRFREKAITVAFGKGEKSQQ